MTGGRGVSTWGTKPRPSEPLRVNGGGGVSTWGMLKPRFKTDPNPPGRQGQRTGTPTPCQTQIPGTPGVEGRDANAVPDQNPQDARGRGPGHRRHAGPKPPGCRGQRPGTPKAVATSGCDWQLMTSQGAHHMPFTGYAREPGLFEKFGVFRAGLYSDTLAGNKRIRCAVLFVGF